MYILVAHSLDFFSVLQFFVASHCRLQTRVTCRQARAKSLLNMALRVISLVQRATGSMVTQWRLVSVTDAGQRIRMSLVKVSLSSYLLSSKVFGNRISTLKVFRCWSCLISQVRIMAFWITFDTFYFSRLVSPLGGKVKLIPYDVRTAIIALLVG